MKYAILIIGLRSVGAYAATDPAVAVSTQALVISTQSIAAVEPSSATTVVLNTPIPTVIEISALDVKAHREREWRDSGVRMIPFRPNYVLPYAQAVNGHPGGGIDGDTDKLQHIEAKFQISFRAPIASGLFWGHGTFELAYTQLSLYQIYNQRLSAPFRSSDYQPEGMLTFETPYQLLGWNLRYMRLSFDHQSNGRSDPDSRSWNRIYGEIIAGRGNGVVSLRPWYRIPESATDDNNPDIERFLGNFELRTSYTWRNQVGSVMVRNNLKARNKGAVELSYSFPLFKRLRGYAQYFNGYGETLIDYNFPISRLGLGLSFSDWL